MLPLISPAFAEWPPVATISQDRFVEASVGAYLEAIWMPSAQASEGWQRIC